MTEINLNEMVELVYKSRATVLDMLRRRGYDTTEFESYTVKDVERMLEDTTDLAQLDIRCAQIAEQEERLPNVLVRYRFTEKLKNKLHNLFIPAVDTTELMGGGDAAAAAADDDDTSTVVGPVGGAKGRRKAAAAEKHVLEGFNRTTDELILIVGEHVGEPFHKAASDAYNKYNMRVSIFYLPDLVVNRLNHVAVPPHTRLPRTQHENLLRRLMITSKSKLPVIRYHEDMIGRMIGLFPGDITKVERPSRTAGIDVIYRHCI